MKLFQRICFLVALVMLCIFPVSAYIDPSVATFATQAIAGVVIAVGTVAGILWRRAKKKVQDKLGIDENSKKEVEDEVVELTESSE